MNKFIIINWLFLCVVFMAVGLALYMSVCVIIAIWNAITPFGWGFWFSISIGFLLPTILLVMKDYRDILSDGYWWD